MCMHHRRIGDNYGETCLDCGAKLAGYGNFGEAGGPCEHRWWFDPDRKVWICQFCERETAVDPTRDN